MQIQICTQILTEINKHALYWTYEWIFIQTCFISKLNLQLNNFELASVIRKVSEKMPGLDLFFIKIDW